MDEACGTAGSRDAMTDRAFEPADPDVFDQAASQAGGGPEETPPPQRVAAATPAPRTVASPVAGETTKPAPEDGLLEPFPEKPEEDQLLEPFPDTPSRSILPVRTVAKGPVGDWIFGNTEHSSLARIMAAFGAGVHEQVGDWGKNLYLSEEAAAALRKHGVFNDYAAGQASLLKALNETLLRSGALVVNGAFYGAPAIWHGLQEAVSEAGEQAEQTPFGHEIGARKLSREIAAVPEAFPTFEFKAGMEHRPVGEAVRHLFQVPEALRAPTDLGVLKSDAQYRGTEETPVEDVHREPETPAPAAGAGGVHAVETTPPPDVHAKARDAEPKLFEEYDSLKDHERLFRKWIEEGESVPPQTARSLREVEARLSVLQPQVDAAYTKAKEGLPEVEAEPPPAERPAEPAREPEAAATVPGAPAVETAPAPSPEAPAPIRPRTLSDQVSYMVEESVPDWIAAGYKPFEAEAIARAQAQYYVNRAAGMEGRLGTPEELFNRERADVRAEGIRQKVEKRGGPDAVANTEEKVRRLNEGLERKKEREAAGLAAGGKAVKAGEAEKNMAKEDKEALRVEYEDAMEALEPEERAQVEDGLADLSEEDRAFLLAREEAGLPLFQRRTAPAAPAQAFPEATINQRGDYVLPLAGDKGAVEFRIEPNTVIMSASYLDKAERGKGLASAAYRRIVDWALASGRDVRSHGAPQADARRLYESLADRGYQVERNKNLAGQTEYRITAGPKELEQRGGLKQGGIVLNPKGIPDRDFLGVAGTRPVLTIMKAANASTAMHELGHQWLADLMRDAEHPEAPQRVKADANAVLDWMGLGKAEDIQRKHHERFANGFLQYLHEGTAPSAALARVFEQFKRWLTSIYKSITDLESSVPRGHFQLINADVRRVFDRLLGGEDIKKVISAEREELPDFHEAHAKFAEEAPPERAQGVAENIQEERDSILKEKLLEEENAERLRTVDPETRRREAGGAESAGHADEADRSGKIGAAAEGGTVDASRGEAASPGAAMGAAAGGDEPAGVGTGRAAPGPDGQSPPREGAGPDGEPAYAASHYGNAESDLTDKIGNYRIDGLNHPEQIKQALRENVAKKGGMVEQYRQGRAGLPASDGERLDLALAAGTKPEWLDAKKIGDTYNSREIKALEELFGAAANAVKDAAVAAKGGDVDAVLKHAEAMARLEMLQAHLAGATAEAGRSLAAVRSVVKKMFATTAQLDAFVKKETGRTLFQMQQMAEMTGYLKTPGQISRFVADTSAGKIKQNLVFYYVNALLSGPITHLRYLVGNGVTALWAPLNTAVASGIDSASYRFGLQDQRKVFLGEAGAELWAIGIGSRNGFRAMGPAWRTGLTTPLRGTVPAELFETAPQAARGPIGQAIAIPSRGVAAIHALSSSVRYEQELAKLAYRKAMQEKLDGQAFIDRVAELTDRPPEDHIDRAAKNALKSLYMAPADYKTFAGKLTVAMNHNLLSKIIVPFMQVGTQIESMAIVESTPLGLFARRVRADLAGTNGIEARNERIAKNLTAMALTGTLVQATLEGACTGDGPDDPKQREVWLRTHKPNSCTIGPISVPYKTFGSLGVLMSAAANATETARGWGKPEDGHKVAWTILKGMEDALLGESFLRGVKDLLDAMYHPEEYGDRFINDMVTNWMPLSVGLGQVTRTLVDPYQRETRSKDTLDGIWKEARAKLPGASETLYPRIDYFGMPITSGIASAYRSEIQGEMARDIARRYPTDTVAQRAAAELPRTPTVYANDPVQKAMDDIHFGIGRLPRKIRNVDLTDAQFYDFSIIAGVTQRMLLQRAIATPGFSTFPPERRAYLMSQAITKARSEAEKTVMMHATGSDNDIWKMATENKKIKKGLVVPP